VEGFITHLHCDNAPIDNLIAPRKDELKANTIWDQKKGTDFDSTSALQHNSTDTTDLFVIILV